MKYIKFILILLFGIILTTCRKDKVPVLTDSGFEKSYGGSEDDNARSIIELNNFLYVFGTTKSYGNLAGNHYLIKMDLNGELIFEKNYGGSLAEVGLEIMATSDGNLLLLGSTRSSGAGLRDVNLIKVDTNGIVLWEQTYGGALDDKPAAIIETSSNQYCIIGTTESYGSGGRDIYLLWTDLSGNLIQEKYYGGAGYDGGTDLIESETGDLVLFGYTDNYGAVNRDFYLMKVNNVGDSIWAYIYGGTEYEESQDLVATATGGFLLIGHSASTDIIHNMYVVKIGVEGNQVWEKNYGGSAHDGAQAGMIDSEGNYVVVGRSQSYGTGEQQIYLLKTDVEGSIIFEETIGASGDDVPQDILFMPSFYVIAGQSNSQNGDDEVFVVKYLKD